MLVKQPLGHWRLGDNGFGPAEAVTMATKPTLTSETPKPTRTPPGKPNAVQIRSPLVTYTGAVLPKSRLLRFMKDLKDHHHGEVTERID